MVLPLPVTSDKRNLQMTVQATANYLNVPERTVRHHLKTKKLLGHKIGKEWFIDRASVDAFAQRYGFVTGPLDPASISTADVLQGQEQPKARFMPMDADSQSGGPDQAQEHSPIKQSTDGPRPRQRVVRSLFSLRVFQLSLEAFSPDFNSETKDLENRFVERVSALKLEYFGFLGRGFYCFHYREKILAYREARNRLAEITALLLSSPLTQSQGKKIESEVLPALGALLRLSEKNHASRAAQGPAFSSAPMMPQYFNLQPVPWGNIGHNNEPLY